MGAVGDERPVVGESEAVEHFSGVPAGAVHGGHPCSELAAGVLKNSVEQNLRASRLRDVKSEELTMNIRFSGGGGEEKKNQHGTVLRFVPDSNPCPVQDNDDCYQ